MKHLSHEYVSHFAKQRQKVLFKAALLKNQFSHNIEC